MTLAFSIIASAIIFVLYVAVRQHLDRKVSPKNKMVDEYLAIRNQIDSCINIEQLGSAERMIENFSNRFDNEEAEVFNKELNKLFHYKACQWA